MGTPLKDLYSLSFYNRVGDGLAAVLPGFDKEQFIGQIYSPGFDKKELKQRMRHTSVVLHQFFPADYPETVKLIKKLVDRFRSVGFGEDGLASMFLADYIEVYGLDDFETSVDALEFVTQFVSCEFAVRPFLSRYGQQMLDRMLIWSTHENHKVRRLASEGSRPRLPWGLAVPALKKDPIPVLPILENLKNDESDFVRRSVANSLNDIAKDHPVIVLQVIKSWAGISKQTDAIIKHGSRTLLKQGHTEILNHYGLDTKNINLKDFKIITPEVKIGDGLEFSFNITNTSDTQQLIRLEYAIFYRMANGQPSKKVFKISEKTYPPNTTAKINRKQKFIPITTRRFYTGTHGLSVIVNGEEKALGEFELC
ncbi:DNA alkylation repair protein [Mucilaginibacter dorajii]|uniref:DNA alkylation repair protein n=1 Tax=Mucilaginibacter dorajii TaxID=692994 RepID=A0ABP7P4Q0_9SPHI|nr:DNA alkylation repair protein [Mucilaginibacter dorajii]MCS3734456.1 3-methyladenine DNA glycosylase AlkC [Mucilaginibacter dorajii]